MLNSPTISQYIVGKPSCSCSFPTGKELLLKTSLTDFPCLQMKPVKQLKSFTYFTERKFLRDQDRAKFPDISFRSFTFLHTSGLLRNSPVDFWAARNLKVCSQDEIFFCLYDFFCNRNCWVVWDSMQGFIYACIITKTKAKAKIIVSLVFVAP